MAKITGYPDFSRLADQEIARQLKYVWDALIGVSDEVGKIVVPDTADLEAAVKKLQDRGASLQGSVGALQSHQEPHGGVIVNPNGILATINVHAFLAPFPMRVLSVHGIRVGGTSASVNARKNGPANHLATALSLTSAATYMSGGSVQNVDYAAGDYLEIMLTAVAGSPTQVGVQVLFQRV